MFIYPDFAVQLCDLLSDESLTQKAKKYLENERLVNSLIFAFGVILVMIGILLKGLLKGQGVPCWSVWELRS